MRASIGRRAIVGSGASLLLLSAAAAGQAKAEELDGELLAACAEFTRAEERLVFIDTHPSGLSVGDPRLDIWEDGIADANQAWDDAALAVAALRARTPEGVWAKAAAAAAAYRRSVTDDDDPPADHALIGSLFDDLLGRADG